MGGVRCHKRSINVDPATLIKAVFYPHPRAGTEQFRYIRGAHGIIMVRTFDLILLAICLSVVIYLAFIATGSKCRFVTCSQMYDVTCRRSFDGINSWVRNCERDGGDAVRVLVGNKTDDMQQRQIEEKDSAEFALSNKMEFMELSVRDGGDRVAALFSMVAYKILHTPSLLAGTVRLGKLTDPSQPIPSTNPPPPLPPAPAPTKNCCIS